MAAFKKLSLDAVLSASDIAQRLQQELDLCLAEQRRLESKCAELQQAADRRRALLRELVEASPHINPRVVGRYLELKRLQRRWLEVWFG